MSKEKKDKLPKGVVTKVNPTENLYDIIPKKYREEQRTYANFQQVLIKIPCQIVIVGATGGGKTTTAINLIKSMNCWTRFYIFAKDLEEPYYKWLIGEFQEIEKKTGQKLLTFGSSLADMPDLDKIDKKENTLILIDDMMAESQKVLSKVSDFFIRSRKKNVSLMYLSQSYFSGTPKIVRENCNYLILKKVTGVKDLKRIVSENSLGVTPDEIVQMYEAVQSQSENNFLMIDLKTNDKKLKYRCNYTPLNI